MSTFLGNLAARSLGTLEVIRPRVASEFETYRSTDSIASDFHEDSESDVAFEPVAEPGRMRPPSIPAPTTIDAGSPLQVRRRATEQPKSRGSVLQDAALGSTNPANPAIGTDIHPVAVQPRRSQGGTKALNEAVSDATARSVPSVQAPDELSRQQLARPAIDERPIKARSKPLRAETASANALPAKASADKSAPGPYDFDKGASGESSSSQVPQTSPALSPKPRQSNFAEPVLEWVLPELTGSKAVASVPRNVPLLEPDRVTKQGSPSAFEGTSSIDEAPRTSPVSISPSIGPSSRPLQHSPEVPTQSEPAIRISIGRVEIRAIAPETRERKAPVPRRRPSVSLDDYLKSDRGRS